MAITLATPDVDALGAAVLAMREWPRDVDPVPLHPGDLGWNWRSGAAATAAAVRTWSRDGRLVALGFLDSPDLVRLAVDPTAVDDDDLATRLAADLPRTDRGVLPAGEGAVELRAGAALRRRLEHDGWAPDEPWTPLRLGLTDPVRATGVRIETVGPSEAALRVAVHRASFERSTFTEQQWTTVAAGPAYAGARCLLAFDDHGDAVAATTVWSAAPGRPGLIEPLGVHHDHRGRGYGTAITLAAAAALRELGSSSAMVCTPTANTGGVNTYVAAGFERLPDVCDLRRPAG